MKNIFRFCAMLLVSYLALNFCTSLKDVTLKEHPGFEQNAAKFVMICPIRPTEGNNTYTLEDPATKQLHEMQVVIKTTATDVQVIDEEQDEKIKTTQTKESTSHVFHVSNPVDSSVYKIAGKTTYYRTKEKEEQSSYESGEYVYPIVFTIYQEDMDVGNITLKQVTNAVNIDIIKIPLDISLHKRDFHVDYQNMFNKTTATFENDKGLVALFGLKPKSFVSTKLKGDILIDRSLSQEEQADIFSMYLVVVGFLAKTRGMSMM